MTALLVASGVVCLLVLATGISSYWLILGPLLLGVAWILHRRGHDRAV